MLYQDLIYKLAFLDKFSSSGAEKEDLNLVDFDACQHYISFLCDLNPTIKKIQLLCRGCILFKSACNAICLEIEHKSKDEAIKIIQKFLDMLEGKCERSNISEKNIELFWKFQFSITRKECLKAGPRKILNYLISN